MGGPPHEDGEALTRKRHGSRLKPSIGTRNGSVEEPLGPASHSGHNCDHRLLVLIRGVTSSEPSGTVVFHLVRG
jgi:hypothetical protein